MVINFEIGNIFESKAEALINPVNTKGVMGKGLALQFKQKFPKNFIYYKEKCNLNQLDIGTDLIYYKENGKIIINFPTKQDWRQPSKLEFIQIGLLKLKELILKEKITSIAIPPLGAGNGGLNWNTVKEELINFSNNLHEIDINIFIYEPSEAEFHLEKSHLLVLEGILLSYDNGLTKNDLSDLVFQKIFYFSDRFLHRNYFKHMKHIKGPFSKLLNILYNDLKKYTNIRKIKLKDLEKDLEKRYNSETFKKEQLSLIKSINLVKSIKEEYKIKTIEELEDKVELASTIVYLLGEDKKERAKLYQEICAWNSRKKEKYDLDSFSSMLIFLEKFNFIKFDLFENIILTF